MNCITQLTDLFVLLNGDYGIEGDTVLEKMAMLTDMKDAYLKCKDRDDGADYCFDRFGYEAFWLEEWGAKLVDYCDNY